MFGLPTAKRVDPEVNGNQSTEEFFKDANIGKTYNLENLDAPNDEERLIADFIACGDLGSADSDATYSLDSSVGKLVLDPVQMPTAPPYKKALEIKRKGKPLQS